MGSRASGEALRRCRPCVFVSCRHHLLVDVTDVGSVVVNTGMQKEEMATGARSRRRQTSRRMGSFPVWRSTKRNGAALEEAVLAELDNDRPTCVLDLVADGVEHTLEETGEHLNITRERVRQIEVKALVSIRHRHTADLLEEAQGMAEPHDPLEGSPW